MTRYMADKDRDTDHILVWAKRSGFFACGYSVAHWRLQREGFAFAYPSLREALRSLI